LTCGPRAFQDAGVRLDPASLIAAAQQETGLSDFGGDSFREGLGVLTGSLEREARLHAAGRQAARHHLQRLLASRLRIEDWHRRHPEIAAQRIAPPLIVIGLPRTGTTALARLLARDPDTRALLTWESSSPVPPPEAATRHSDPRIAATQAGIDAMRAQSPGYQAMYDADADDPSECQDLLGMEFRAQHFSGSYWVPSFGVWQKDCDMRPGYAYHKRTLQLLQWHCGPERWLLKTPTHMLSLDALAQTYPDARFIMTHRDPVKVLASVCSLMGFIISGTTDSLDRAALAKLNFELWAEALERALDFRRRAGEARFADLHFHEQNADPVGAVERAYARLGLPFTPAARANFQAWAGAHRRGQHGEHRYRLADWGLDERAVRERYAFYTKHFDVRAEPEGKQA
jgi:hypothetical protein